MEFGIIGLFVLFLGWDIVSIYLRTDGDTCHSIFLLNFSSGVPFGQVRVHLVFGKGGIYMFLAVIVELVDVHFRNFVLPRISPNPLGIAYISRQSLRQCNTR